MKIANLLLIYLYIMFFSRVLVFIGFPSILNIIHILIMPIIFILIIINKNILKDKYLMFFIVSFFFINIMSSVINDINIINALINFAILYEPFLFFYVLLYIQKDSDINKLYKFFIIIFLINLVLVLLQNILFVNPDHVQGILIGMGNGAHIVGAISMLIAVMVINQTNIKTITKILVFTFAFIITTLSDAKQIIVLFGVVSSVLLLMNVSVKIKITIFSFAISIFLMLNSIHYILPNYGVWIEQGYEVVLEGFTLKYYIFNVLYCLADFINVLIGFGPGQTVSRLSMMIPEYTILANFGIYENGYFTYLLDLQQSHYLTNTKTGSSMFTLMFSWSGIYGDLGIFGLTNYLLSIIYIYYQYAQVVISKFLIILLVTFGSISLWFGESIFMITLLFIVLRAFKIHNKGICNATKPL